MQLLVRFQSVQGLYRYMIGLLHSQSLRWCLHSVARHDITADHLKRDFPSIKANRSSVWQSGTEIFLTIVFQSQHVHKTKFRISRTASLDKDMSVVQLLAYELAKWKEGWEGGDIVTVTLGPPAVLWTSRCFKAAKIQHEVERTCEAASFLWRDKQAVIETVIKEQSRHMRLRGFFIWSKRTHPLIFSPEINKWCVAAYFVKNRRGL